MSLCPTTPVCLSPLLSNTVLSFNTCVCVCVLVCEYPPSPDTPALCFVRIPVLLYLTFWTTQVPEIELQ